jgi:hypothetical protein
VKFALEVHPTEIAYDFVTTRNIPLSICLKSAWMPIQKAGQALKAKLASEEGRNGKQR